VKINFARAANNWQKTNFFLIYGTMKFKTVNSRIIMRILTILWNFAKIYRCIAIKRATFSCITHEKKKQRGMDMNIENPIVFNTEEEKKEFTEGLAVLLNGQLERSTKVNVRIAELLGMTYDFSKKKKNKKNIPHYAFYLAEYMSGSIDKSQLIEKIIDVVLRSECGDIFSEQRARAGLRLLGDKLLDLILPGDMWEKLFQKILLAREIAIEKEMDLKDVFASEDLNCELERSMFSIFEQRQALKRSFCSVYPDLLDQLSLELLLSDEIITDEDYEKVIKAGDGEEDADLMNEIKKMCIATIIANEETYVEVYGDSKEQRDKRNRLLEILEGMENKTIPELISKLMNSQLFKDERVLSIFNNIDQYPH